MCLSPTLSGAGSLQEQGEQVQGAELGWAQLNSGPSKPGKLELCPCVSLWGGTGSLCLTELEECV